MNIYIFEDSDISDKILRIVISNLSSELKDTNVFSFSKTSDINIVDFSTPAIIIADINLQDGTFFDCVTIIRKHPRWAFPIFLISGEDHEHDFWKYGADEFFLKPYNLHTIRNRICKYSHLIEENMRTSHGKIEKIIGSRQIP